MFFSIQIFQQVFYHFIFLGHAPTVRICKPGILYINFFKKMVRVHNLWLSANLNWATKNRASLKKRDRLWFFNPIYLDFRFLNSMEVFWNWHISHKLGYLPSRAYAFILFSYYVLPKSNFSFCRILFNVEFDLIELKITQITYLFTRFRKFLNTLF